jgi:glycosyltransferase involved in cell wall biosynthesis
VRHALFVAFHYPPEASSSGVLRTLKYSRYLADYGWRVTVIAPEVDAYSVTDKALENQIPSTTRVIRTRFLNTKRHLSIRGIYPSLLALPDTWIGWLPWAVKRGHALLREDPVDLIYSTSPHATAHLIARRLAKACAKPWVTDFRDPWVEDPPEPGTPDYWLYRTLNGWLERRVISDSDAVVTSTTHLRDLLQARYPSEGRGKVQTIFNGYDEADFTGLPAAVPAASDHFVMLHAGSINRAFRDPRPLFRALHACGRAGTVDLRRTKLRFLGPGPFAEELELKDDIDRLGLRDVVEFLPRVPYSESIEALTRADSLVLLQASPDTVGLVPAKLYEYLRSQKPVLALVPQGATGEVLAMTGGGWSIPPENNRELEDALSMMFRRWSEGRLAEDRADLAILRRFDRKALTGQLAALFDRLAGSDTASEIPTRGAG